MAIVPPEALAIKIFDRDVIKEETKNGLFFKQACVVIFDGLIIYRGDINMVEAIPYLQALAKAFGLPIGIIEKESFPKRQKRLRVGRYCGPGMWLKSSWTSAEGLDKGLSEEYDEKGLKIQKKTTGNTAGTGKPLTMAEVNNRRTAIKDEFGEYPMGMREFLDDAWEEQARFYEE